MATISLIFFTIRENFKYRIFFIQLTFLFWCDQSGNYQIDDNKYKAKVIVQEGYIISTEEFNEVYFLNSPMFFLPFEFIDRSDPFKALRNRSYQTGVQFEIRSSYYHSLINCMGVEIRTDSINKNIKSNDPLVLTFETERILPVALTFEFENKDINSPIDTFHLVVNNDNIYDFKARRVKEFKIFDLDILLKKEEDIHDLNSPRLRNKPSVRSMMQKDSRWKVIL